MSKRKILALLLAVVMVCSLFVSPALAADDEGIVAISDTVAPKFTDADGHWAENAIVRWAEAGIIEGDGDGTINPARSLKRAELATILVRLLGLKDTAPADTFSDVAANAWYADAVLKCAKAGIMLGDGAGKANPEAPISRQEAIVMIGRALGVKPATGHSLDRFDDGDTVADWATPYMIALTDMKILSGLPTGEGDGAIVAPGVNIDRASTFTLLDKAIAQYITAPCTVTVDDANKFVVINSAAEETGTVTVTGTTAGVVVAIGTTDDVVLNKADVGTLKVDAPVDVIISKGSSVDDLDANAATKIDNKGTVTNLNTNADGVTFDGNKPTKVTTAEDVKPATDSKGNEVTDKPASSGGSTGGNTGSTTYKYNVSISTAVGGKVTADVTRTNEAHTEVTLTVTPDAQTATSLPYVLKSLTVKNGETEVTVNNNKFTMDAEGTYTVTAEFVRPITEAELFIVNSEETFDHLADFGYTDETTDMADLPEMQWIAVGVKRAEGFDTKITDAVLTANGADMSGKAWPGEFGKYSMAYVNKNLRDEDPSGAKLELEGFAYKFVLTFTYEGASYKLECDYLKYGVTEANLHTVTFKTSTGTELATYKAAATEKVTAPAAPAIDGYYFTGWDTELTNNEFTVGEVDATVTAEYVKITDQKVEVRPAGPAGEAANFDYQTAYKNAGITGTTAVVIDGEKMLADNAVSEKLLHTVGDKQYVFYGLQFTKPADATSVVVADTVEKLGEGTTINLTQESDDVFHGEYINYINVSKALDNGKVVLCGEGPATFTYAFKWMKDGEIVAVTTATITRTTKLPRYDVTFKLEGAADDADPLYVAEKAVAYGATEIPEEVKNAARAEIAKKYSNVTIELDEMANYTVAVTLTTDVEKLITVTTGTTAFGGDFGDKVTPNAIQDITFAEEKNGKGQIVVEGSLYYTEWPEFSSIQNEQVGYYSALSVPAMEKATVKYNNGEAMSLTEDVPPFVTIMGGADAEDFTGKGVKLEIDLDGEGPIQPATYVYNFSNVKAVRWDVRNAEIGSAAILKNASAGNDMKPAEGVEGVDDIRVIDGKTYVTFEVKDLPITADHVVAIGKETEDGVKMYTAVTQPAEGEEGRQPLPGTSGTFLIEAEAEKTSDHGKGWTLLAGTEAHEETWYFWTVEGKCVKVVFTVPAAPAAQTPEQGETASLSAAEPAEVVAPVDAIVPADDEVAEIPLMD